jgi:hypothetical protein
MGTAHPAPSRPRPATPAPRARQQPTRHPRWWGRPLALGLALLLVAAMVPGAHADTDDGGGMPISESVEVEALDAKTSTQMFDAEPPVSPEGTGDRGGNGSSDTVALAEGGETSGAERSSTGEEEPLHPASLVVAEHHQEDQQPDDQHYSADGGDPLGEAEQLAQQFDASLGCSADGRCPDGPGIPPGAPTLADTRGGTGGTGPGGDQPQDRSAGQSPGSEDIREAIFDQQKQMNILDVDIAVVRGQLRDVSPETWAERTRELAASIQHPIEDLYFQNRINRIREHLQLLSGNVQPETEASRELAEAQNLLEELSTEVARGVVPRRPGESLPSGSESTMSMVAPDAVGRGQPTTKGNQVEPPKPTGFGSNQPPEIPNQTVLTPPDEATKKLVAGNLEDTPPQIDTSIPPTRVAELGYIGSGLAVLLAALLAVGCKGAPCSSMLRPAFRGFQGVPGQMVPGDLQG